jgi:hypothetical protein
MGDRPVETSVHEGRSFLIQTHHRTHAWMAGEPLANPVTPLYKDPATMEAEMQAHVAMERAAAAKAAASTLPKTDPRDAVIQQVGAISRHPTPA